MSRELRTEGEEGCGVPAGMSKRKTETVFEKNGSNFWLMCKKKKERGPYRKDGLRKMTETVL